MADVQYADDAAYRPPTAQHAPRSLLDFAHALAPVVKYYAVLLFFWFLAKRFNSAVETEAELQEKERERPTLTRELMESSSEDEESEEESEEEIYEELVTDGSRLVSVPGAEGSAPQLRERKTVKKKEKKTETTTAKAEKPKQKVSGKSHPLFEGLKKVEEELKEQRESEKDEPSVSWNELHMNMLKRYKQKYPEHGLRTADGDDYDDEFKDLLKKHNVNLEELKKEQ